MVLYCMPNLFFSYNNCVTTLCRNELLPFLHQHFQALTFQQRIFLSGDQNNVHRHFSGSSDDKTGNFRKAFVGNIRNNQTKSGSRYHEQITRSKIARIRKLIMLSYSALSIVFTSSTQRRKRES